MQVILELLAPGNKTLQEAIRERVGAATLTLEDLISFSGLLKESLYPVEYAKLFWGVRVLGILKEFSPTLRIVGVA